MAHVPRHDETGAASARRGNLHCVLEVVHLEPDGMGDRVRAAIRDGHEANQLGDEGARVRAARVLV